MCLGALRGEHSLKVARSARALQRFPHSLPSFDGMWILHPALICGWCPMPSRTLANLWVVPHAQRNPPKLVGGTLCPAEPSQACGWCPMPGGTLRSLSMAECPEATARSPLPHTCTPSPTLSPLTPPLCPVPYPDPTVHHPVPTTCVWCPMPGGTLPFLWVVAYAGQNPLNSMGNWTPEVVSSGGPPFPRQDTSGRPGA